jgi:hypothetical protein
MFTDDKAKELRDSLIEYILQNNRFTSSDTSTDIIESLTESAMKMVDIAELGGDVSINDFPLTYIIPLLSDTDFERLLHIQLEGGSKLECIEMLQYTALSEERELRKKKSEITKDEYYIALKVINLALVRIAVYNKKMEHHEALTELQNEKGLIDIYKRLVNNTKVNMQNNQAV